MTTQISGSRVRAKKQSGRAKRPGSCGRGRRSADSVDIGREKVRRAIGVVVAVVVVVAAEILTRKQHDDVYLTEA